MASPAQARRLTRTLRHWRTQAGFSIERAAEDLLCGAGTVSRMESGASAEPLRVKAALELYGAPAEVVAQMVQIAKDRRRRKVPPRPYHEFTSPTFAEFLDLEAEATAAWSFQSEVMAGLLQTERYARAVMSSVGGGTRPPEEISRNVDLRIARQNRLTGDNALNFRTVLGESTLYNQIGGPTVLLDQLEHVAQTVEENSNVELRIMPFTAGNCAAFGGNFTILAFEIPGGSVEPEAIFIENPLFFVLQDETSELELARRIYDELWESALDSAASVAMINLAITRLRKK